jgi:hypothetical protein
LTKKIEQQNLIILYIISIVGFVLKTLSNDANFITTIFIYFE